jgi:hypothetical protein
MDRIFLARCAPEIRLQNQDGSLQITMNLQAPGNFASKISNEAPRMTANNNEHQ